LRTMLPEVRMPQSQKKIFLFSQRSERVPSSLAGLFPQQKGRTRPYTKATAIEIMQVIFKAEFGFTIFKIPFRF